MKSGERGDLGEQPENRNTKNPQIERTGSNPGFPLRIYSKKVAESSHRNDRLSPLDRDREQSHGADVIQGETLAETVRKIADVDPEKRKLIVYAGYHPHERTDVLAQKYAAQWAEKYGVLTVCHPTRETVNALWEEHRKNSTIDNIPPLPKTVDIAEEHYTDAFSLGKETFFISFHGTPLSSDQSVVDRKLAIFTSLYEDSPDLYEGGVYPLRYSRPEIVAGLDKLLPDVEQAGYPGNVVTVEFYYQGEPVDADDPYVKRLQELEHIKHSNGVPLIYEQDDPKWWKKAYMGPHYLIQPKLSEEDAAVFEERYLQEFNTLLNHLSRQITHES